MEFTLDQKDHEFREQVRDFCKNHLPKSVAKKIFGHERLVKEDYELYHRALDDYGWGAPTWPKEYGGTGWSPVQKMIFEIETFKAGAPKLLPFGMSMIAPVLMKYANQEMKDRFLSRIPRLDDWWCQGYSEPGAGSDLANLKTKAVKVDDGYIVNGQKTWTTLGQYANWIFCLVRTDPDVKPQRGISLLLIDMNQPGITVKPIKTIDGFTDINEVWLEDVHVPFENLVGNENEGWTYAKYLLGHERTGIAGIGLCHRELAILKKMAKEIQWGDKPAIENQRLRDKITLVEADVVALEMLLLRAAVAPVAGAGAQSSALKIRGSELQQKLSKLQQEVAGPKAYIPARSWLDQDQSLTGFDNENSPAVVSNYLDLRKVTIYGGSNEIQKNIISKIILK